jgi:hypothetical protein
MAIEGDAHKAVTQRQPVEYPSLNTGGTAAQTTVLLSVSNQCSNLAMQTTL